MQLIGFCLSPLAGGLQAFGFLAEGLVDAAQQFRILLVELVPVRAPAVGSGGGDLPDRAFSMRFMSAARRRVIYFIAGRIGHFRPLQVFIPLPDDDLVFSLACRRAVSRMAGRVCSATNTKARRSR